MRPAVIICVVTAWWYLVIYPTKCDNLSQNEIVHIDSKLASRIEKCLRSKSVTITASRIVVDSPIKYSLNTLTLISYEDLEIYQDIDCSGTLVLKGGQSGTGTVLLSEHVKIMASECQVKIYYNPIIRTFFSYLS